MIEKKITTIQRGTHAGAEIVGVGAKIFYALNNADTAIPHFCYKKQCGNTELQGKILFTAPEYYKTEGEAKLTKFEAGALCKIMNTKVPEDPYNRTYFQRAVDDWNAFSDTAKLPDFLQVPNYSKLK